MTQPSLLAAMDRTFMLEFLDTLLRIPSPSGYCQEIMDTVKKKAEALGFPFEWTNKGCGIVTIPGRSDKHAIGLSAHVDTLGAMVRSVTEHGTLKLSPIGGYAMNSIEGEYCTVHTRDGRCMTGTILTTHPSVHVYDDARDQKREEANMEVRLDERVNTDEDVRKLGIGGGDVVSFDPRVAILDNGFVKSRHLDDKAGVAAVFGMIDALRRLGRTPACTVKVFISVYEEVGHGSSYVPDEIDELIAVDMGALGDDLQGREDAVSICAKDSSGPYDYGMTSRLIALAEEHGIRHAVDVYPHYGSDASAALRGGRDIRAALMGPGVHASHGMERTHMDAVAQTAALLTAYVLAERD